MEKKYMIEVASISGLVITLFAAFVLLKGYIFSNNLLVATVLAVFGLTLVGITNYRTVR